MSRGLWRRIKKVALTDVGVLLRGVQFDSLENLERVLLEADLGSPTYQLIEDLETAIRRGGMKTEDDLRKWLTVQVAGMLTLPTSGSELNLGDGAGPGVLVFLGVNGVGKTTQAAKIANRLLAQGKSVMLAAGELISRQADSIVPSAETMKPPSIWAISLIASRLRLLEMIQESKWC